MEKINKIEKMLYDDITDSILQNLDISIIDEKFSLYEMYTRNNNYNKDLFESVKFLVTDYRNI
jgi:hypothetical protein